MKHKTLQDKQAYYRAFQREHARYCLWRIYVKGMSWWVAFKEDLVAEVGSEVVDELAEEMERQRPEWVEKEKARAAEEW